MISWLATIEYTRNLVLRDESNFRNTVKLVFNSLPMDYDEISVNVRNYYSSLAKHPPTCIVGVDGKWMTEAREYILEKFRAFRE